MAKNISSLGIMEKVENVAQSVTKIEKILGKGLLQPFNNTNSASRKLMYSSQLEQILPIMDSDIPDVTTGYEVEFASYASSLITAEEDYEVIAIVPKYLYDEKSHYTMVVKTSDNRYTIIERIGYGHISESYGYILDNRELDCLNVGGRIRAGKTVQKSQSFDKYGNRQDGVNMRVAYMAHNKTTEDGIIISASAAKRLASPFVHQISVVINDNDIPLNLYGNSDIYKSFPNVGENIKNGILCAIRRDRKEESLYTQSFNRLSEIMISDEKYPVSGKVVDINIRCNNPEGLEASYYNGQLKHIYDENMDYHRRLLDVLDPIMENPDKCSYELKKLFMLSDKTYKGVKHMNDKVFSNTILEITVLQIDELAVGDKLTDRYGGKGVVSEIRPDELMPQLNTAKSIDIIFNIFGCVNRENPGQLFEVSTTSMSSRLVDLFRHIQYNPGSNTDELLEMYYDFMSQFSPAMSNWARKYNEDISDDERAIFMDHIIADEVIKLTLEPISESLNVNALDRIYTKYDWMWMEPYTMTVPILGSDGQYRFVEARRKVYSGRKYIHRLKQYPKDKFSATSLSSTNIRSEPTKSKANKNYKFPYTKTPIRFGEMETGDFEHIDVLTVVKNLMLHSSSPIGRKQTKNLYTDDPFNVNIELTDDARNRNVEILNVYLKTMGLKLVFKTIAKKLYTPFTIHPFTISNPELTYYTPFEIEGTPEDEKVNAVCLKNEDGLYCPFYVTPFTIV
jgi:DNA-directed RNA polymerase beta subunit